LLDQWRGQLTISGKRIELSINNLMLKGSILRQNEWVIGLVTFVGSGTKY
jgi:phospholipid-translocating ATPase